MILEPKKIQSVTGSIVYPCICHEMMELDALILDFLMLSFKSAFSLFSFTSSKGSLVPLHFLPLAWYHLHIWMYLVTQSCLTLCNPMNYSLPGSSVHEDSPGKNTGVGCLALLQGIFPTQGSNPGLLHCRRILYHLSHQGSPRILEWGAYPFPRESSRPRNQTKVSCITGGFFKIWATGEAQEYWSA